MRNQNNRPTHPLWLLPTTSDSQSPWKPVGAAWVNGDWSINCIVKEPLHAGDRVQLRARKPSKEQTQAS